MDKDKKIHRILNLCIKSKKVGSDCFFEYSPHVNSVAVQVFLYGWRKNMHPDNNFTVYLDLDSAEETLDVIIVYLKQINQRRS